MKKIYLGIGLILLLAGFNGCVDRSAKERVAEQREAWESSLKDSVANVAAQVDSVKTRIGELRSETDNLLANFKCVDNPKEVEKYYLPQIKGYAYPLDGNGLAARLMANEQLELVASFTGPRFTAIRINGGGESVSTPSVAPDQALNYRSGNTTTVAFSGKEVDSIAYKLARMTDPITVIYLEGGKKVGETRLSDVQAEGLRLSSRLAYTRRETLLSEKMLTLLSHKLERLKNLNSNIEDRNANK